MGKKKRDKIVEKEKSCQNATYMIQKGADMKIRMAVKNL